MERAEENRTGDEVAEHIRLLLVEDDADFRSSLAVRLHKRGFDVVEVASAEEALGALEKTAFDAVVSDIRLPGTDGMEFLAQVRRRNESLPVILITGYASLESAKEAVTLNASDYLLKPLDSLDDLLGPIHKAVHSRRLEIRNRELEERIAHMQKMEALGKLAGGVAHDFNNVLTAIQGYSDLAMSSLEPSDPVHWQLKQISEASVRGSNLTQQLLLFGHEQPTDFMACDINRRIADILPMLEHLAGESVLIVTDSSETAATVHGDGGKIEMLLMNLVINARDAMPHGGRITIRTEPVGVGEEFCRDVPEAKPGRYVCLSVIDEGTGMDEKTLGSIFDPFFTTKEKGQGTGLGLSVVYGVAKEHGGWIRVSSAPGEGSTFKVYLPASAEAPASIEEDEDIPESALRGEGERLLVVENEAGTLGFLERALSSNGYEVCTALSASDAMLVFEQKQGDFHMLFSDVRLPDGTGVELSEQLRGRRPNLKVLLGSGYRADDSIDWNDIRAKGFPLVEKPYSLKGVLNAVKKAVSRDEVLC